MEYDLPKHVLFWPWAFIFGPLVVLACWRIGKNHGKTLPQRAGLSLVIACAVAPAAIFHGARPFVVYAFPLLFTSDPSFGLVASLPPIVMLTGLILSIWSWRQSRNENRA